MQTIFTTNTTTNITMGGAQIHHKGDIVLNQHLQPLVVLPKLHGKQDVGDDACRAEQRECEF